MKTLNTNEMSHVSGGSPLIVDIVEGAAFAAKVAAIYTVADVLDNDELDGSFLGLRSLWNKVVN